MSDRFRGPGLLQTCGTLDARNVVGIIGLPLRAPSPEISGEFVERILSAGSERKAENSQKEEGSFHECAILLDKAGEVNVNARSRSQCCVVGGKTRTLKAPASESGGYNGSRASLPGKVKTRTLKRQGCGTGKTSRSRWEHTDAT